MKKYLLIYHATPVAEKLMASATPKQQAKAMEAWNKWGQKWGAQIVDMGAPLMGGLSVGKSGEFKKSRKNAGGYSIIQADNMAKAQKLLKGHPHIKSHEDCTIEIHEVVVMPGV